MSLFSKLEHLIERHKELEDLLSSGEKIDPVVFAERSREYSQLEPVISAIKQLMQLKKDYEALDDLLKETDPALREMAHAEKGILKTQIAQQEEAVRSLLLPPDVDDCRNAIVEIRAGTGGEEAALFAADLLRMYRRYSEMRGWSVEVLQMCETDHGGMKEVGLLISGKEVFSRLKFEAGVHRVQRVPETESSGRIHTSAATVAVLPEVEEVDIDIDEKDIQVDVFRSSGPGGQSVNTTDSAVRITHIPTGVVVQQQDEKSQHKNKAKAMKVLRARLYDKKREEEEQARASDRQSQVGRGDRSERIRTYNFPQGRVTDHRIKLTLHKLQAVLEGEALDEVIEALIAEDRAQKMMASAQEN